MTYEQIVLFSLIGLVLVGLLWGRWRYDLVSFAALIMAVALGAVPVEDAFAGFGHEATIIVALVLIISAGLQRSGAVDLITRFAIDRTRSLGFHVGIFGALGAVLSAFMNNVATLAILMPVDLQASRQAKRNPAQTLMPLSFATILGGLVTLIGTPPNIIIAAYRTDYVGQSFGMFDFAPVGIACALVGLLFISFIGWRLIPLHNQQTAKQEDILTASGYVAELVVPEGSKAIGQRVGDLDDAAEDAGCEIMGLVRKGKRVQGKARRMEINEGDLLVVRGGPDSFTALSGALGVKLQGKSNQSADLSADMVLTEVVVTKDSRAVGRTANSVQLLRVSRVSLVGLSRSGTPIKQRLRQTPLQAGDVLLLLGEEEAIQNATNRLHLLPLADRNLPVVQHEKAFGAIALFAAAIIAAVIGIVPLPVALGFVALGLVVFDILPVRELYDEVEWPVIVLLGSMIPLGTALDSTGGTTIIAHGLEAITAGMPSWVSVAVILIVTMTLSDVLNNTATAVIAAPIGIQLANATSTNADTYLMAVAVGASCAFLTPIGHKNNMLILGPGGYKFGDYWRMGLPLEIIVTAVAVPMILLVWPL